MPTRVSSAPLTRRSLPKARCGSLFLAHPRQILTQSLQVDAACGRAAQLFYARVHCPFLQAALPSLALLACLLHRNIHTLLVAARCRHSLRHRFPAGLPLRSLTDCFISSHPFITVDRHALLASTNTQQQTKQRRPPATRTRLSLLNLSDLFNHKAASCDPLYHEVVSQLGYLQPSGSRILGSTTLRKQIADTLPGAV